MERYLSRSPVKIKGAGIRGLALAYFLKQQGIPSVIYEASHRAGGWIRTIEAEGFLFEAGPRGFRAGPVALKLIHDLGLQEKVVRADPAAKKRYIYHKGKLCSMAPFMPRLCLGLLRDLILPKETKELSIRDHFTRRLGSFCMDHLIDPLTAGIYAGDTGRLSARKCFPSLTQGSILKGLAAQSKTPLISFQGGMQTLIDRLMQDQEIRWGISDAECDWDCTPSPKEEAVSLVAVNLGWKELDFKVKGFGYLIPSIEKEPILGAVFDSCSFPSQNRTAKEGRITVMMGGASFPDAIDLSEEELKQLAWETVSRHLHLTREPDVMIVHKAKKAILQPVIGSALNGAGVNHAIEDVAKLAFGGYS
jgi:oxygen-dependent protoporphyrinogen oxidase